MANIYEKMATIRVALQNKQLKKSGENTFAKFKYYTLEDILPAINQLLLDNKVFSIFNIENDVASLTFVNAEKVEESVVFKSPIADADIKGSTPVQCLGGVHTYLKRYLYLNAFEVVDGDILDALAGTDQIVEKKPKTQPKPQANKINVGSLDDAIKNLTYESALNIKIPSGKYFKELKEDNLKWFMNEGKNPLYKKAAEIIYEHDYVYPNMAEQIALEDAQVEDVPF